MKKTFATILLFLLSSSPCFAAFSYSLPIVIQPGQVGGLVATPTGFPVDVDITQSFLKSSSNSGHVVNPLGYDIYFYSTSDCSTTRLPAEREIYTATTGQYTGWVKVATLSTTTTTTIYACYGDGTISTDPNTVATYGATSVWDANYKAVWHLPDGTTLNRNDSTTNANNLSNFGSPTPAAGVGKIDGALSLSGSTGYIGKTSPTGIPTGATARTIEAWTKVNSLAAGNAIIQFGNVSNTRQTYLLYTTGTKFNLGTWADDLASLTTLSTGTWYHVLVTYDGSVTLKLYLNGVLDTTYTLGGALNTTLDGNGVSLGAWPGASAHYMNGIIDEARISNNVRSVDWITTEYNNQSATSTFYTLGSESSFLTQRFMTFVHNLIKSFVLIN